MIAEYALGGTYIAAAPVEGCLAFVLTFALHRLLMGARLYRWFWHPALVDTALFVIVWALMLFGLFPFLEATFP